MTNIWGFLLQTLSVSAVALVLLIIKRLLLDKIAPSVQYALWLVLIVRILLPVRAGVNVLFPFPVWLEVWKAKAERSLSSAYSGMYDVAGNRHILPMYGAAPVSVTDWLFVVYGIGILAALLYYAIAYIRLRLIIARGAAEASVQERVERVAEKYGLRSVNVRLVEGITSPFVCGVIRPMLVLPGNGEVSELVILHELLHMEHHDPAKNMIWCVFRALHWCNPFLWYVVNRIENDTETCCDQRVLECIEGEERRLYGKTLLAMANNRYARMPGTSSISNGEKNITRRIEAIARFKKYPRGMSFVLFCMTLLLASTTIEGQAAVTASSWQRPSKESELDYALAESRLQRCTTLAGALDTYAKSILYQNGIYLALASPLSDQAALEAEMRRSIADGWVAYHVDRKFSDAPEMVVYEQGGYYILNLRQCSDGSYEAFLLFASLNGRTSENRMPTLELPVRAYEEKEGWVVKRTGEATYIDTPFEWGHIDLSVLEPLQSYEGTSAYGSVRLDAYNLYELEPENPWAGLCDNNDTIDQLRPSAEFSMAQSFQYAVYDARPAAAGKAKERISFVCAQIPDGENEPLFPEQSELRGNSGGSSGGGYEYDWVNETVDGMDPYGLIETGSGGSIDIEPVGRLPEGYGVQIYWDGELVDELRLEEKDGK